MWYVSDDSDAVITDHTHEPNDPTPQQKRKAVSYSCWNNRKGNKTPSSTMSGASELRH